MLPSDASGGLGRRAICPRSLDHGARRIRQMATHPCPFLARAGGWDAQLLNAKDRPAVTYVGSFNLQGIGLIR